MIKTLYYLTLLLSLDLPIEVFDYYKDLMDDQGFFMRNPRETLHLSHDNQSNKSLSLHSQFIDTRRPKRHNKQDIENEDELNHLLDKLDNSENPSNAELLKPSPRVSTRKIKLF